jgi:hypothetical protein
MLGSVNEILGQVKPATRAYLIAVIVCTTVNMLGLPAPELLGLDSSRLYEIWRPITAVSYLGAPSMSMASNIYFLIKFGQSLESVNGTGTQCWFLLIQLLILTLLGLLLKFPFQAQAMIAATVYVSCHLSPLERV